VDVARCPHFNHGVVPFGVGLGIRGQYRGSGGGRNRPLADSKQATNANAALRNMIAATALIDRGRVLKSRRRLIPDVCKISITWVAAILTQKLMVAADRKPTSELCRFSPSARPQGGLSLPPELGPFL
jgi:hypothetical protein